MDDWDLARDAYDAYRAVLEPEAPREPVLPWERLHPAAREAFAAFAAAIRSADGARPGRASPN